MIGRIHDNQGVKEVDKFKSKVNHAGKFGSSKIGQTIKVDMVVGCGKTGRQRAEVDAFSEANK